MIKISLLFSIVLLFIIFYQLWFFLQVMLSPIVWQLMEQATLDRFGANDTWLPTRQLEWYLQCTDSWVFLILPQPLPPPHDPYASKLNSCKVYDGFIFYQCMRDKKKRGGTCKRRVMGRNFSRTGFDSVMNQYHYWIPWSPKGHPDVSPSPTC
jgi:hypothetical protein